MPAVSLLQVLLTTVLADRRCLALEILALRQEVAVLRRGVKRPRLEDSDRLFWIGMLRLLDAWRQTMLVVQLTSIMRRRLGTRRVPPRGLGVAPNALADWLDPDGVTIGVLVAPTIAS